MGHYKFKIGDIIRCISDNSYYISCYNKIGKIIYISKSNPPYTVEFFEEVDGHDGWGKGKDGCCWDFYEKELKLYKKSILKIFLKEKELHNE